MCLLKGLNKPEPSLPGIEPQSDVAFSLWFTVKDTLSVGGVEHLQHPKVVARPRSPVRDK